MVKKTSGLERQAHHQNIANNFYSMSSSHDPRRRTHTCAVRA